MGNRRVRLRWPPDKTLGAAGFALAALALSASAVSVAGVTFPAVHSPALRVLFAVVGVALLAASVSTLTRPSGDGETVEPRQLTAYERAELIETVRVQRIRNGLDLSLGHAAEMTLGLADSAELVSVEYLRTPAELWAPADVIDAYNDAGGQLVILGAPGAGKTTQALLLVRHLLDQASADPSRPVPELFVLASWANTPDTSLIDWLATEIRRRHGYPVADAKGLIAGHQIVAFLDGLDEVAPQHRPACVAAINRFLVDHRRGPLVVCSRLAEYQDLDERLNIGAAVAVQPPTPVQVDRYLQAAGPAWEPIRRQLPHDDTLRQLLATPLLLAVAVRAYQHNDPAELTQPAASHSLLWSRYLDHMQTHNNPPGIPAPYTNEQVRRWLGWLAHHMRTDDQAELWLHEQIGPKAFQRKVRLAVAITIAAITTIAGILVAGLTHGLAGGLAFGLVGGQVADPIPQVREKHFDWIGMGVGLGVALGVGLAAGLADGLGVGLGFGMGGGLAFGLVGGLVGNAGRDQLQAEDPTDGYIRSAWLGLAVGLGVGLGFGLAGGRGYGLGVGLAVGLGVGLDGWLGYGLGAAVFHWTWRWVCLRRRGFGPFRWPVFLAWAADHLYLRSTGPSYQWVHLELRDYLADNFEATTPPQAGAV